MPAPRRRILVVEDNLDAVRSLVVLLREMGYETEYAINGYAALEAAKKFHPECVLLDLGLPGMTGFEVCTRLRAEPGMDKVRIFSITAYSHEEYRQRAISAGCNGHYVKPVSAQQLDELLKS